MFDKRKILVVEDDENEVAIIEKHLRNLKAVCRIANTVADAQALMETDSYDYILSDLHLQTRAGLESPDGLNVISFAKFHQPSAVIVATSSDPRSDVWSEALKAGAQNFIRKPLSKPDELVIAFGLAFERKLLTTKENSKKRPIGKWLQFANQYPDGLIIDNFLQKRIKGMARHADKTCVIVGETGSGKEEIAKLVHQYRCLSEGQIPFIPVNCATITGGLTESILFGHRKGAFTGAESTTVGYIGEADRGILFLDEIQTLDLQTQQKLLRVLNDGTYNRLGETKSLRSQFQLIAASTKDLDEEVEQGKFLLDLRTRMIGLDIVLKPLRDRVDEIPAFVALFLHKRNLDLAEEQFEKLVQHVKRFPWKGNIRQMFKTLDAWVLTCELDELPLTIDNFPLVKDPRRSQTQSHSMISDPDLARSNLLYKPFIEDHCLEESVDAYEKALIAAALSRHQYRIGAVSSALKIPRSSLDNKRRKYGLMA